MKRLISATALCLAFGLVSAACDDDGPGAPPTNNGPTTVTFRATLTAANEVPPVTNVEANASGVMDITLNLTRDAAGTITAATANFTGTLTGFPAGTALTAAHIHTGAAGATGGPIVNLGLSAGEIALATGAGGLSKTGITVSAANAEAIIANPAGFYFNAHPAANPGGAVRGQLIRTS